MLFDPMTIALCGFGLNLLMALVLIAEKLFGGGNALASKFANLKEDTNTKITAIRTEFIELNNIHATNARVGFEAITANIHSLQLGFSDFRAMMAETYMRRESFYKAAERIELAFDKKNSELKVDMKDGFARLEKQIDDVTQIIEENRKATIRA